MTEESNSDDSRKLGVGMVVAMWVIVLALLTAYFSHWEERQFNPNKTLHSIASVDGVREVVLKRNRYGHYVASGAINNVPVVFMLDTGATDISVPQAIADQLDLQRGPTVYYQTANGNAKAYITRLDNVSLGDISLQDVRAHINPNFHSDEILLGMTFLKHLEFSQKGDTLTLRQYQ
ncbi:retropepsin-like aspartic protease family protein [Kaarinaea lacus]